jgi:hypothetical protein
MSNRISFREVLRLKGTEFCLAIGLFFIPWLLAGGLFWWVMRTTILNCSRIEPLEINCAWFAKGVSPANTPTQTLRRLHYAEVAEFEIEGEESTTVVFRPRLVSKSGESMLTSTSRSAFVMQDKVDAINQFVGDTTQSELALKIRPSLHHLNLIFMGMAVSFGIGAVPPIIYAWKEIYQDAVRELSRQQKHPPL